MLAKYYKSVELLSQGLSHKPSVVVERPDVSLIASVEKNWSGGFVKMLPIN